MPAIQGRSLKQGLNLTARHSRLTQRVWTGKPKRTQAMTDHTSADSEPLPRFLDFEASSLASGSYPIEVAWSGPDGTIESHLISPANIGRWTDWSAKAEQLHGIRRGQLLAEGRPPSWICQRLNEALHGETVYTDAPDYDGQWLTDLFSCSWIMTPRFTLASADEMLIDVMAQQIPNRQDALKALTAIKTNARQQLPERHRAARDVAYLVEVWLQVNG